MNQLNISPYELIFLNYLNGKLRNVELSYHWNFKMKDPIKSKEFFITEGLLYVMPGYDSLIDIPIQYLRDFSKAHNLKANGKKELIISRIVSSVPNEEIKQYFKQFEILKATEQGASYIRDYGFIIEIYNQNYGIDYNEALRLYDDFIKQNSAFSQNDFLWYLLNKNKISAIREKGLYRNIVLGMYKLLLKENKKEKSLAYLLAVLYLDINSKDPFIAPGLIKDIVKLKKEIGISNNDVDEYINKGINENCQHIKKSVPAFKKRLLNELSKFEHSLSM